ncbi:uncharacterized protein LOC128552500 [Mercenaria mercenaria]|uniref:uncharacterized protein LOC128552500 n=1 Tax=Mercenaria mercenaria TaxID=6596 RepID=UPI00234F8AAB|nr:uncharacterized protein LOC128552500 [Mercenaria mercenaria]
MHGPSWLNDETTFPGYELMLSTHTNSEHEDTNYSACMTTSREITPDPGILDVIDINRFDTYRKLIRVTAYVLRFVNNCRNIEKVYGPLESHEINAAAKHLIKYVQSRHFPDVIEYIYQNRNIQLKRPNLVRQLDLFLDDDKLIRCGGRLSNAPLLHSTRFPYLLPSKDNLTKLIILDAHVTHMHSGTESTVTYLRQIFWIPSIRQRVQKIVRSCVTCRKVTGRAYRVPDPPPLPSNRLKVAPPFTVTGIDFTGAFNSKGIERRTTESIHLPFHMCQYASCPSRNSTEHDCGIIYFSSTTFLQQKSNTQGHYVGQRPDVHRHRQNPEGKGPWNTWYNMVIYSPARAMVRRVVGEAYWYNKDLYQKSTWKVIG